MHYIAHAGTPHSSAAETTTHQWLVTSIVVIAVTIATITLIAGCLFLVDRYTKLHILPKRGDKK